MAFGMTADVMGRVEKLFDAVDLRDANEFVMFLTDDVRFRFGNGPAAEGKEATRSAVAGFFTALQALSHETTGVTVGTWEQGDVISAELLVTYTTADGRVLPPLPAVSVLRYRGDLISDYRVYMDVSPVFAPAP